ncbi:MAG TPA: thiamine phosphate synthase [Blastocatellia bacterium]|nr:thiamine phosphate synthase [Blastocatellia bacterium]
MKIPALYPITSRSHTGLSHAEIIAELIKGGATLIQLREKTASPREFYKEAEEAVELAHRHNAKVIINDRVDIALAVGADGVHLGQDDLPPEHARRLMGDAAVLGYSTHSVEQAIAAAKLSLDYIAIGPIFQTNSKENPDPIVGLEMIRTIKSQIDKPLVAIGGITLETASSVWSAGADSVAVISDLYAHGSIASRVKEFCVFSNGA